MTKRDKKLHRYIMQHGKLYTPALLPEDVARGPLGRCFDNCAVQALYRKYGYVEGFALRPGSKDGWILHAWLTDESGKLAYDPTWKALLNGVEKPMPTIYYGIQMPIKEVSRFMMKTGYTGVLANAWRDPELAEKAGILIEKITT